MLDVGVRSDQLRERTVLQRFLVVHAFDTRQVIQPVAVLQGFHLGAEDVFEGGAEHAAEQAQLFGETADPHVDVVDAGNGTGAPGRWRSRDVVAVPIIPSAPLGGGVNGTGVVYVVRVDTLAVHEVVGVDTGWR